MASEVPSSAPPFLMTFQLTHITFDCGPLTPDAFSKAPGGNFGKVLRGAWRGIRVAVKIIPSQPLIATAEAEVAFRSEAENLLAVRSLIDRARLLETLGHTLTERCGLLDSSRRCSTPHSLLGYRHLVLVYGVGTEPDLAPLGHPGPAHLIVMEELTGGTLQGEVAPPGAPLPPLIDLLQTSVQLASGLATLAAAHVVHADVKVGALVP